MQCNVCNRVPNVLVSYDNEVLLYCTEYCSTNHIRNQIARLQCNCTRSVMQSDHTLELLVRNEHVDHLDIAVAAR